MSQGPEDRAAEELTFEQALAAVEKIVHELEEGQTGLAESLGKYEEGVKLLRRCYGLLEGAERRIELVSGVDAQGNPVTKPYKDQATIEADPQEQRRSRRRSWEGCTDGGAENRGTGRDVVDDGGGVM
jgi:exodeoxyribonuclease VII small subunit